MPANMATSLTDISAPPAFTITQVAASDGPALAAANIPAFWADPHWQLVWRHRTLEYHISQVALRYPRNLLRNRDTARHQKAVDRATGEILGYIRWTIPASHATVPAATVESVAERTAEGAAEGVSADGTERIEASALAQTPVVYAWPEAVIPAVPPEEEAEMSRVAETAVWDPDCTSDPLTDNMLEVKNALLEGKTYMTLDYLAVNPAHQRRGVATALVRSGIEQAKRLGLDIFVHAFMAGLPVYQRLGFRLVRELVQDDSQYGGPGLFTDSFLVYEQGGKTSE